MIKTIIAVCVLFGCHQARIFAQENNPFNQRGVDYFRSLEIISNDIKAGKVKDFTEESLAYYSKTLPLQGTATVDMAAAIIKKVKGKNIDLADEINKSSIVSVGKKTLLATMYNYSQLSASDYQLFLSSQCDIIKSERISDAEKEFILTIIAIEYNGSVNSSYARNNEGCTITTDEGTGGIPCWLAGAVLGGTGGWYLCGWPCAIGGAIIGGLIGGIFGSLS